MYAHVVTIGQSTTLSQIEIQGATLFTIIIASVAIVTVL